LVECLESLAPSASPRPKVVLVDNHSSDGSAARAIARLPWVELVQSSDNVGFGRGVRLGAAIASGAYLAIINPDVVVRPGVLGEVVAFLEEHPRAGAAAPAQVDGDGVLGGPESLPGLWSALGDWPLLSRLRRQERRVMVTEPTVCGRLRGACLVLRRLALEEIGGFPDDTFLYGEEILLGHRLRGSGWEQWYLPHLAVDHEGGHSTRQRWDHRETSLLRRRSRIAVMREVLGSGRWRLWNELSAAGLWLQIQIHREPVTRRHARDLLRLHREPGTSRWGPGHLDPVARRDGRQAR
jgi:GT2 family glycosyltransferase